MRRRTFDRLVSTEGLVLVPILAVAGGLLTWGQRYITNEVRDQLAEQKIYFPASDSPELAAPEFEPVRRYAGQQLTTGVQAKAYADRPGGGLAIDVAFPRHPVPARLSARDNQRGRRLASRRAGY